MQKQAFRSADLFYPEILKERIEAACEIKNVLLENLYHMPKLDPQKIFDEVIGYKDIVEPYMQIQRNIFSRQYRKARIYFLKASSVLLRIPTTVFIL